MRWVLAPGLAVLLVAVVPPAGAMTEDQTRQALGQALSPHPDVAGQAEALIDLAWMKPDVDPALRTLARKTLGEFGQNGVPALARAMARVRKEDTADVVRVLLDAASRVSMGTPPDLLGGLREALWTGSADARRLVIPELARQRDRFSLLLMIDAAEEDPSLLPVVVPALGQIGDDRARFYLAGVLVGGKAGVAEPAAVALARIGGRALEPLRDALRSTNRSLRLTAARAILPVASENDLTALYEYVAAHPTDDPPTIAAIADACSAIEALIEARRAAEAASAPQDF
jgi:HEAT repeat protein